MTVDRPLSAGRMMIELSSRSECRAFFCSVGKFSLEALPFVELNLFLLLYFQFLLCPVEF